jgi:hypothetical protein
VKIATQKKEQICSFFIFYILKPEYTQDFVLFFQFQKALYEYFALLFPQFDQNMLFL